MSKSSDRIVSTHIYNVNESVFFKHGELEGKDKNLCLFKYIVTSEGHNTIIIVHGFQCIAYTKSPETNYLH